MSLEEAISFRELGQMQLGDLNEPSFYALHDARPVLLDTARNSAHEAGNAVMLGFIAGVAIQSRDEALAAQPPHQVAAILFADIFRAAAMFRG